MVFSTNVLLPGSRALVGEGVENMLRLVALVTVAQGSSLVVMPGASQPATGPSPQRALLDDQRALLVAWPGLERSHYDRRSRRVRGNTV